MAFNFDIAPYFDDFEAPHGADVNNYMRILFKPGFAVQARELTQVQSMLQAQVQRLGDFVLQDGSPVSGGQLTLDTTPTALWLQTTFSNTNIVLGNFLVGGQPTLIQNVASAANVVQAVVVATDTTQAFPIVIVKYLTANVFYNGDTIQVANGVQSQATLISANATNPASTVSIHNGIFYRGGFFVNVQAQTISLDATTNKPNSRVGLTIDQNIINATQDSALLDPAQGSFNYQAPGADRYQYELVLDKRSLSSTDDSQFFELLRVQNGLITKQIDYPLLGDIDATLARRTYDEAGDFLVTPFVMTMGADTATGNSSNVMAILHPGKAYVKGYEFETIANQYLPSPKAITTNTVTQFGMALNYENFVTATNVAGGNTGFIDLENYQIMDLHIVPSANINTTNSQTYSNTKVGVARVRNIEFLGLNNWFVYLTSVAIAPISFIAAGGSTRSITFPSFFSQSANAYANVQVTVNTAGVIDTRYITTYGTAGAGIANLNQTLSIAANSTSNITLNFMFKDVESIANTPSAFTGNVYYNQNTTAAINNCMDIAVAGRDSTGNTVLQGTNFNTLLFPLPQQYIAQNTIVGVSYEHRKNLYNQTFTSGNLTITSGSGLGTGESFPFGFTNSYLPDLTANLNFMVVIRNQSSSNIGNGVILQMNQGTVAGGNGVYQTDGTHVTISAFNGAGSTFVADVIFTCNVAGANSVSVARRSKTLVGNSLNTSLAATDSYLNGTVVNGNTNYYIDTSNGVVWIINRAVIPNTPGSNLSLFVPDVFNVIKVFDSGSASFQPNSTNAIDISPNYYLDSGQRDNHYGQAKLTLKPGFNPPTGQVAVLLQYYNHDSVIGFFDNDSYPANVYLAGTIPFYNSQKYGTFTLRDCIDFRPTHVIGTAANVQGFTLSGYAIPEPSIAMVLSYQYYLGRIDKLQLTKNKGFKWLFGTPAQYPLVPADVDDSINLYVVTLPPQTANLAQIGIQYIPHKRYTMQDISTLDDRISQLEYYSQLSQLESQSTNETILYNDGVTAKDTYGIIADDFGSFSISDTQNPDLRCYMAQGYLAPFKLHNIIDCAFANSSGAPYHQHAKVFSLGYTETIALAQNNATDAETVQPYMFGQFKGKMKITPETDTRFSFNLVPVSISTISSPAKETPPARAAANTTTTKPPIMSSRVVYFDDNWYDDFPRGYGWYRAGGSWAFGIGAYRVTNTVVNYGYPHVINNWYGQAAVGTYVASSTAPPNNLGTPIIANPGKQMTTANVGVVSIAGQVVL